MSTKPQSEGCSSSSSTRIASSFGHAGPSHTHKRTEGINSSDIDSNQCCVCFRTYEDDIDEGTGLEWVECSCKRWLHEECIDYEIECGGDGQELLCPFCCV